jgi:hypothetical protein
VFGRYERSLAARNASRGLLLDLRLARQAALAEHLNVLVVFAGGPGATYEAVADEDGDFVAEPGERRVVARTLSPSVTLDASGLVPADSLAFLPSGRLPAAWPGGEIRVGRVGEGGERVVRAWPSGAVEAAAGSL